MSTATNGAPETTGSSPAPAVSVVLPVLNEARCLGALLDQLADQVPPPGGFEVLVADGGSTDGTRELVAQRAAGGSLLRLVDNPGRRSGPGRNAGAALARGRVVMFLDGHCLLPRRDYLVRLDEIFRTTGADCLCRPQPLVPEAGERWSGFAALARQSPLGHKPGSEIFGAPPGYADPRSSGAAYPAGVLSSLGGYDERFDACEDVELNHRLAAAGGRAYFHPDLAVHYRPRRTPGGLFRQMFRYGRGRARLFARHPSTFPVSLAVPAAAIPVFAALAPVLGWPAGATVPGAAALLWISLCAAEGIRLARRPRAAAAVASALALIHLGLLLGFGRGLLDAPRFRGPGPLPGKERHVPA